MQELLVLLAHGSSDKGWSETFRSITDYACRNNSGVKLAFLGLSKPSLLQVTKDSVKTGVTSIKVLPLFLASGRHLKHDVPTQLRKLELEFGVSITLLAPIGEQAEISKAINDIITRILEP